MLNELDNYERLEQELRTIRKRVFALEKKEHENSRIQELETAVFNLNRTVWWLQKMETQRRIDEYLNNYKPKRAQS